MRLKKSDCHRHLILAYQSIKPTCQDYLCNKDFGTTTANTNQYEERLFMSTNHLAVRRRKVTTHIWMMVVIVLAMLTFAMISKALAFQGNGIGGIQGSANAAYAIGLWGDLPYSSIQASVGVPNLI